MNSLKAFGVALIFFATGIGQIAAQEKQEGVKSADVKPLDAKPSEAQNAEATKDDRTLEQKAFFLIGFNLGTQVKSSLTEISEEDLIAGVRAALKGQEVGLSEEEIQAVMRAFAKKVEDQEAKMLEELAAKNTDKGEKFLAEFATKEGVKKTESGIFYRIVKAGPGQGEHPKVEDRVRVHYTGKFTNGEVFFSSVGGDPAIFTVGGLIPGLSEGLQLFQVGDKIELAIPAQLAYGKNGNQGIGPNEVLNFEIELLELNPKEDQAPDRQ